MLGYALEGEMGKNLDRTYKNAVKNTQNFKQRTCKHNI